MRYLHTMIRAANLDDALDFFISKLGLVEAFRYDNEAGRFTLVFLSAPDDLEGRQSPSGAARGDHLQLGCRNL